MLGERTVTDADERWLLPCRSPTIVIAYLMKLRGWRLAEAYKWVKDKRPNINISAGERACSASTAGRWQRALGQPAVVSIWLCS